MINSRPVLWITAVLAAGLGTYLLYDAPAGINWGIWVAAASLGLVAARLTARNPVRPHTLLILTWATVLAFAASITTVELHSPIIVATVAILLGLAVTTLDDPSVAITLDSVAMVPFAALSRVFKRSGFELLAVPASARGIRRHPALAGIVISMPIVVILVLLLSSADPLLDSLRNALLGWMDNWSLDGRVIFFAVLSGVTLGAYGLAAGKEKQLSPPHPDIPITFPFSPANSRIILGSVNAVLWLFVLLQVFSFTRDPGGSAGTGLTYAEYARRGFAELSFAAAIVLGIILLMEVFRDSTNTTSKRYLELAAIFAIELILASAFRRVLLYEDAYGYTTERLIAQLYMLVLAASFVLLAWDLSRGAVSQAFGRRGMILTLAAITAFIYWNYEGWVVRQNFERASNGTDLDLKYLNRLSMNAVPALVEGRQKLSADQRAVLDEGLRCRKHGKTTHWYEWNLRREKGRAALASIAGSCASAKPAPSVPLVSN